VCSIPSLSLSSPLNTFETATDSPNCSLAPQSSSCKRDVNHHKGRCRVSGGVARWVNGVGKVRLSSAIPHNRHTSITRQPNNWQQAVAVVGGAHQLFHALFYTAGHCFWSQAPFSAGCCATAHGRLSLVAFVPARHTGLLVCTLSIGALSTEAALLVSLSPCLFAAGSPSVNSAMRLGQAGRQAHGWSADQRAQQPQHSQSLYSHM
jgi:hypothetical protein